MYTHTYLIEFNKYNSQTQAHKQFPIFDIDVLEIATRKRLLTQRADRHPNYTL